MTAPISDISVQASNPVQSSIRPTVKKDQLSHLLDDFINEPFLNWPLGFLDSRCTYLTTSEYNQIRSLRNDTFSTLFENHNLSKLLAVLPRELLRQKFNDEFGALSNEELVKKFGLKDLGKLDANHIFPTERIDQIKGALKFSDLFPQHTIPTLLKLFSLEELKAKFDQEFSQLADADLLAKFDTNNCDELFLWDLLSGERLNKLYKAQKELVRQETGTFSELLKKHGVAELSESFSVAELTEKFNAEWSGKTEREILAGIDLNFFMSKTGKEVIGDRFKDFFAQGPVKIEKEGVERTFDFSSSRYSVTENIQKPDGYSYISLSGSTNK